MNTSTFINFVHVIKYVFRARRTELGKHFHLRRYFPPSARHACGIQQSDYRIITLSLALYQSLSRFFPAHLRQRETLHYCICRMRILRNFTRSKGDTTSVRYTRRFRRGGRGSSLWEAPYRWIKREDEMSGDRRIGRENPRLAGLRGTRG